MKTKDSLFTTYILSVLSLSLTLLLVFAFIVRISELITSVGCPYKLPLTVTLATQLT